MTDLVKLSTLLDDPESRELIFGLAHVRSALPPAEPGPARLHAVVLRLADTTHPEQYRSWLSDDERNRPMTVDQVRTTVGDVALDDLAQFAGGSAGAVAWQLAAVLPDVVDAVSPGGEVMDVGRLGREIKEAIAYDDRSTGAFGY
jgi:YidB-like protein